MRIHKSELWHSSEPEREWELLNREIVRWLLESETCFDQLEKTDETDTGFIHNVKDHPPAMEFDGLAGRSKRLGFDLVASQVG